MATSPRKKKSAMDSLIDRFSVIIERGAQEMNAEQLRESEKRFNDAINRAVAKANHGKGPRVGAPPPKKQSAVNSLLKSMDELAVGASKKMTTDEVREVRKQINDLVDRAAVGRASDGPEES